MLEMPAELDPVMALTPSGAGTGHYGGSGGVAPVNHKLMQRVNRDQLSSSGVRLEDLGRLPKGLGSKREIPGVGHRQIATLGHAAHSVLLRVTNLCGHLSFGLASYLLLFRYSEYCSALPLLHLCFGARLKKHS